MPAARRLSPLLALACLLLALAAAPGARAAESCTTALGGAVDRPFDAPFADDCATAILIVSPDPAAPGALVTLDGSQSSGGDGGDEIARYEWDFGDGGFAQTLPPDASVTHVYARGVYTTRLTLIDTDDAVLDSTSVDLMVSELPVAVLDALDGTLRPGVSYDFDATGSSAPGGSIDHYEWDWGDGSRTQTPGPVASHAFAGDEASRAVTVTVVNDLGLESAPASVPVTVRNQLPSVVLVATPATVNVGQQLTLDASGSNDPDGTIAEYRWDLDANGSYETSTGTTPSVLAGGYPNAGVIVLRVRAIDDSGGATVKAVAVTVVRPAGSGGGGSGSGGSGGGGGAGGGSGAGGAGGGGAGGGARSGGAGGGPGAGAASGDAFAVGLSGKAIQRLTAALRRGVALSATANRTATGKLSLELTARDAKALGVPGRRGKRPVAIGTLKVSLAAGRTAKPKVKLTRAATRALRRAKPRTVRVTVRGALTAGSDNVAVVRVVLLRG